MLHSASKLPFIVGVVALIWPAAGQSAGVSFRNEVMAVLSRGGCNAGACHGSLNGKNGFKLSLRGEDAEFDYRALTREPLSRRVDPQRPDTSLVLQKASAVVPHEGGLRWRIGAPEYAMVRRWIAEGAPSDLASAPATVGLEVTPREQVVLAPADHVNVRARATFADGSTRDVTSLAVFEPSELTVAIDPNGTIRRLRDGEVTILVRYLDQQATIRLAFVPARPDFTWNAPPERNYIDHHVFAKLQTLRIRPSRPASDALFLRRVYLDVLGILPTSEEARRFLADPSENKRDRLIDDLLRRPEYADFWALKWADLLRNEEKTIDAKGVRVFHDWIRTSFSEGKPLDQFARELITGRGSTYSQPAANYYRALRDPLTRAEATAQVFLGIRLQCARCHNHPFERWKQADYHAFASFFSRVRYRIVSNDRRDNLDQHEFSGEQIVWNARVGEGVDPRTGKPLSPRLLGSSTEIASDEDRLTQLAEWITRPDNPFFARAQANRIWQHLVGRGIVEPNDDFRASNPPVNGPLLEALASELVSSGFDPRHLMRTILQSQTYQLSSLPDAANADEEANFAHAIVRPLQAEQLFDGIARALEASARFKGMPPATRAGQLPGVRAGERRSRGESDNASNEGDRFLKTFGKPGRALSCECERSDETTLAQAFQLITGPILNRWLTQTDNRLGRLLNSNATPQAMVEELYLATLTRYPSPRELASAVGLLEKSPQRRLALEDLAWGLVNSKEFLLRR